MSFDSTHKPPPQPQQDAPKRPEGMSRAEWRRSMKPKCQRVAGFKVIEQTSKRRTRRVFAPSLALPYLFGW